MPPILKSLLLVIATATDRELARHIKYLKAENDILRSKLPKRVPLTTAERNRLARFAAKLGRAMKHLVSIVVPTTMQRWIREWKKNPKRPQAKRGRPRTAEQIRRLVLKMARDIGWGYTRILGELRKLRIFSISRTTVKNILAANGYDTGPKRGEGTWDEFIKRHAVSLWQCDFFSVRSLTVTGFRDLYVLVFLNVLTREVVVSPATQNPDEAWVCEQADSFVDRARARGLPVRRVQRDRDGKFGDAFDNTLRSRSVETTRNPIRAPNTNAYAERFIRTIRNECLDHFVVLGERHLNHLCAEFLAHYHQERPHQGIGNELIRRTGNRRRTNCGVEEEAFPLGELQCETRLGGLLRSYSRRAA